MEQYLIGVFEGYIKSPPKTDYERGRLSAYIDMWLAVFGDNEVLVVKCMQLLKKGMN
jgi:hypothetical protein